MHSSKRIGEETFSGADECFAGRERNERETGRVEAELQVRGKEEGEQEEIKGKE